MAHNNHNATELRRLICEIGRRLYDKACISGTGGNISARLGGRSVLITPSQRNKGFLSPDDMAVIDMEECDSADEGAASSEKLVHLHFYRYMPRVGAVIHAHPPAATAFAMAGQDIDCSCSPETMVFLGDRVPLVPYETPSTQALSDNFTPFLNPRTRAYLMQNHGVVTIGDNLEKAFNNLETLELYARTLIYAGLIGSARPIAPEKIEHLKKIFNPGDYGDS